MYLIIKDITQTRYNHKYDKENVSTKYSSLQGLNQNVIQMHYLEQYLANAIIWKTARHFGDL